MHIATVQVAEDLDMNDWNEIAGHIGAYAVHIDARRWSDLLELYAPEVDVDYSSLLGGKPQFLKREQLIAQWRQFLPGFTQTTHLIGPPAISVTGKTAQASASIIAWHFIKEPALVGKDLWIVGGCYEMSFAKLGAAWRITSQKLVRAWWDGNQDLPRLARERATQFAELHAWLLQHLHNPELTVEVLADEACMSVRNFARVYKSKTGRTPGKAIELFRLEAARQLLEDTDCRIESVAQQAGFGDEERMRTTFQRHLGVSPRQYRERSVRQSETRLSDKDASGWTISPDPNRRRSANGVGGHLLDRASAIHSR